MDLTPSRFATLLAISILAAACSPEAPPPAPPPPAGSPDGTLLVLETRACNWLRPPDPNQCDDVGLVRIGLDGEVIDRLTPSGAPMSFRNVAGSNQRDAIAWAWNWELYVMELDTGAVRLLTRKLLHENLGERVIDPAWSAGGASIVYRWSGAGGDEGWYRVDVQTGQIAEVTMPDGCRGMAWEVSGRWMACEMLRRGGDEERFDLVVVDLETGEVSQVTDPDDAVDAFDPVWSPDGQWLAFATWTQDPVEADAIGIFVFDPEAGGAVRVAAGQLVSPSWSPSGDHLAAYDEGGGTVVVFGRDGSGLNRFDHEPRRFVAPLWYPLGD